MRWNLAVLQTLIRWPKPNSASCRNQHPECCEAFNTNHDQPIPFLISRAKQGFIVAVMTFENRWATMAISTLARHRYRAK